MNLTEFLLRLASDPELLQRFAGTDDKEGFLREQGLEGHALQFLLSGDLKSLRVHIEGELEIGGELYSFGTVHGTTVHVVGPGETT